MLIAQALSILALLAQLSHSHAALDKFSGHPPFHLRHQANVVTPTGLTPTQIKTAYNLPTALTAGQGKTVAIVDAYDNPAAQTDLTTFSRKFNLPTCATGCFTKAKMGSPRFNQGWAMEESLDLQWAHAIAPGAKLLLVEARSASGNDLLSAVDYARRQPGVVAVSLSWGGSEFSGEAGYDTFFTSQNGLPISFFAASGDNGSGASWPAASPNVTGVGGTSLTLTPTGAIQSETGWAGSGGGVSTFEPKPTFQQLITGTGAKRSVPDVSYDADPNSGFAVYDSNSYSGQVGWFTIGGTSAGAPQWAALQADGGTATNSQLYHDASLATYPNFLRDITQGSNGGFSATTGYDLVTGLGTPKTAAF